MPAHTATTSQRPRSGERLNRSRLALRACAAAASLAALISLSACGGGGGDPTFDIGVVVAGQPVGGTVIQPGPAQQILIAAGQSLELDASESVQWTLLVGGTAVTANGATVYYNGVNIAITALSPSRIALDTLASYPLATAVPITLTAASTFDSTLVATVDVVITN